MENNEISEVLAHLEILYLIDTSNQEYGIGNRRFFEKTYAKKTHIRFCEG